LKKSLYGLKQAPRQWYLKFDRFMTEQGYNRCHSDHCVYFKRLENGSYIILPLYVDDMLVAGSNMQDINDPGGYLGPPTFSKWLKTVFWPFWQFTIFSRFSLPGPF
jgi:hypothetical protein